MQMNPPASLSVPRAVCVASTSWQVDQEARIFSSEEVQAEPPSGRDIVDADENLLKEKSHGDWAAAILEQLLNSGLPGNPAAGGAGTEKGRASHPVRPSHLPVFSCLPGGRPS